MRRNPVHTIRWRKSSHSGDSSNCVEIATTPAAVLVRDSKDTSGPRLGLSPTTWAAFLAHLTQ
ncbi:regulator [Streptomyces sp. XY152]|nr:regulator [Streptomyces sp. XY152]